MSKVMSKIVKGDVELGKRGIIDPVLQRILIEQLPCGIKTTGKAFADTTSVEINAPRALMVVSWKGMATAFALLERERLTESQRKIVKALKR